MSLPPGSVEENTFIQDFATKNKISYQILTPNSFLDACLTNEVLQHLLHLFHVPKAFHSEEAENQTLNVERLNKLYQNIQKWVHIKARKLIYTVILICCKADACYGFLLPTDMWSSDCGSCLPWFRADLDMSYQ